MSGGEQKMENGATQPLCRCRVRYIGSAVPTLTKDGLMGIQEPLKQLYPMDKISEHTGIDSWLCIYSNGIVIEYTHEKGRSHSDGIEDDDSHFYPIDSLHYCAAVRFVDKTGFEIDGGGKSFVPLDSPLAHINTKHPTLFAAMLRRTTGVKVLECHAFITSNEKASNALVRCCFHAYADTTYLKKAVENGQLSPNTPGVGPLLSIKDAADADLSRSRQNLDDSYGEDYVDSVGRWGTMKSRQDIAAPKWQSRQQAGEYDTYSINSSLADRYADRPDDLRRRTLQRQQQNGTLKSQGRGDEIVLYGGPPPLANGTLRGRGAMSEQEFAYRVTDPDGESTLSYRHRLPPPPMPMVPPGMVLRPGPPEQIRGPAGPFAPPNHQAMIRPPRLAPSGPGPFGGPPVMMSPQMMNGGTVKSSKSGKSRTTVRSTKSKSSDRARKPKKQKGKYYDVNGPITPADIAMMGPPPMSGMMGPGPVMPHPSMMDPFMMMHYGMGPPPQMIGPPMIEGPIYGTLPRGSFEEPIYLPGTMPHPGAGMPPHMIPPMASYAPHNFPRERYDAYFDSHVRSASQAASEYNSPRRQQQKAMHRRAQLNGDEDLELLDGERIERMRDPVDSGIYRRPYLNEKAFGTTLTKTEHQNTNGGSPVIINGNGHVIGDIESSSSSPSHKKRGGRISATSARTDSRIDELSKEMDRSMRMNDDTHTFSGRNYNSANIY